MKSAFLLFLTLQGTALAADHLRCGVITEPLDWNKTDLHGSLAPLEVEICRAIATARDGSADHLEIKRYASEDEGVAAVHAGQLDVAAGITPDFERSQSQSVRTSLAFFEDAQGFMVHRAEGVHGVSHIAGRKLCYIEDTDNDATVLAYLAAHGVRPVPFGFQEEGEMDAAIMDRHCQVASAYLSKLAEARATFHDHKDYVLLPDRLSVAPVSVASAAGNLRLAGIVDATISVLLEAESLGVTRARTPTLSHSEDPRMQRLTGEDYATAAALGLPHDWSRRVVAAVGNYGEVYDRTVGPGTELDLPRGLNALWEQGGVMVPLPLR